MVNMLLCSLSPWTGDPEKCRWCNDASPRGGRNFCSRECTAIYMDNHIYPRGRERVGVLAIGKCDCYWQSPQGAYFDAERGRVEYLLIRPPHKICAACRECEEEIALREDRLTCNHIEPRMGLSMHKAHCIHHMENLEMLCWRCHSLLNRLGNERDRLEPALAKMGVL